MGIREFTLTDAALRGLVEAEQATPKAAELRRLQAVRLYGTGASLTLIQQVTQAGERTVRRWVARYIAEGMRGLAEHWHGGNRCKLSPEQRGQVAERVAQYRPVDLHLSEGEFWTVSDLQVAVEQWYGVVYADQTSYQRLLHDGGLSYQRTVKVYRSQPSVADIATFEAELEKK